MYSCDSSELRVGQYSCEFRLPLVSALTWLIEMKTREAQVFSSGCWRHTACIGACIEGSDGKSRWVFEHFSRQVPKWQRATRTFTRDEATPTENSNNSFSVTSTTYRRGFPGSLAAVAEAGLQVATALNPSSSRTRKLFRLQANECNSSEYDVQVDDCFHLGHDIAPS